MKMLQPTKHSHPDRTVIYISTVLLKRLRTKRVEEYSKLLKLAAKVQNGDLLFMPAVNLLYLLGLIEYRPKIDSFEYVGPK